MAIHCLSTPCRQIAALAVCALLAAPLVGFAAGPALFIAIDDLNDWAGFLGGHPQARTPHIDALAGSGTAFLNAYCPAPVCGPSRTALMYGIAPHRSGSYGHHTTYDPINLLSDQRLPLNRVFQLNGYHTAGCGKIFHYRETRGWDHFLRGIKGMAAMRQHLPTSWRYLLGPRFRDFLEVFTRPPGGAP